MISSAPRSADQLTGIFLHNYKAGGTTLRELITRQYPPGAVCTVRGMTDRLSQLVGLDKLTAPDVSFIQGHIPFGVHTLLRRRATYITVLREPVERVISLYTFLRVTPDHEWHHEVVGRDLARFLATSRLPELDNGQTRRVSGESPPFGACSRAMLDRAQQNLREQFAVVGTMERFDETLLLLKRTFKWRSVLYTASRVSAARPSKDDLSEQALALLRPHTELDGELYRYAECLLEEQLARQGSAFRRELQAYQLLHALRRGPASGRTDGGSAEPTERAGLGAGLAGDIRDILLAETAYLLRRHARLEHAIRRLEVELHNERRAVDRYRRTMETSRVWRLRNWVLANRSSLKALVELGSARRSRRAIDVTVAMTAR